jgi:hypothetical protein
MPSVQEGRYLSVQYLEGMPARPAGVRAQITLVLGRDAKADFAAAAGAMWLQILNPFKEVCNNDHVAFSCCCSGF